MHDPSSREHEDAIGHLGGEGHALLDEEDGEPFAAKILEGLRDVPDDDGREPFGRLVEEQEVGVRHQGAADGEHLLLAAREVLAGMRLARREPREEREDAIEVPASGSPVRRHLQVLQHRERGKDPPTLRDEAHPHLDGAKRRQAGHVAALEDHPPLARRGESDESADEGGLSHAVAPEDGHHLALRHAERHAVQHVALAVVAVDLLDRQHQSLPK